MIILLLLEGAPESDAGYVQFLEELKANPGEILRKKVYVWREVSEIYIYDTAANKWENKRDEVTEDATTDSAHDAAANTTTEGADKTDANADDAAKTAVVPDDKTDSTKNDTAAAAATDVLIN